MNFDGLTNKEVAERYTNYEVGLCERFDSWKGTNGASIGIITGYTTLDSRIVIIDPYPVSLKWFDGIEGYKYVHTRVSNKPPTNKIFRFYSTDLILHHKTYVKPVPYPSKCSFCQQPSRKLAGFDMCSNVKCKSNKAMKKVLAKVKAPKPTLYNYLVCPLCSEKAIDALKERIDGKATITALKCLDHDWQNLSPIVLVDCMRLAIPNREKSWSADLDTFVDVA